MASVKKRTCWRELCRGCPVWLWPALTLALLSGLSLVGKLTNRFAFFIYPDSYYYLLVAENLRSSWHPVGTLGVDGQPFPPMGYAAMKSTFPTIVALVTALGIGSEQAGHTVAVVAAVTAVPVAYVAALRLADSKIVGVTAAALVATSYGVTYWSGFVMSDSVSVLLGFAVIALIARERADEWSNAGDILTGVALALLILSRPTYVVAVPALLWLGVYTYAWTQKRMLTAVMSSLLLLSLVAALWFPPAEFGVRLLRNLLPVLASAFAVGVLALLFIRRRAPLGFMHKVDGAPSAMMIGVLAAVLPLAFLFERGSVLLFDQESFFIGLYRFVVRDPATVLALIPGAVALSMKGKRDIAAPLIVASIVLLGVYYWVEPRESRYLIHLLPFLVPVAASSVLLLPRMLETRVGRTLDGGRRIVPILERALLATIALVLLAALVNQGQKSLTRAQAGFLRTDYPREVSLRAESEMRAGDVLVTALPWPYYFRLRHTTWVAGVIYLDDFSEYLPGDTTVLLLSDASLRFHFGEIAQGAERRFSDRLVTEFDVPTGYQYGYSAVADPRPVRMFRMSASELRSLVSTESAGDESTSETD